MTHIMYDVKVKVSKEQVEENRENILEAAARLFRQRGIEAVTVAEVMHAAGLTHGAFYGYFDSKEGLAAAALAHVTPFLNRSPDASLTTLIQRYLSASHRDTSADGCVFPAFAADATRQTGSVRLAYTKAFGSFVDGIVRALPGAGRARRKHALAIAAQLVGAVVIARALDDPKLSDEVLTASMSALLK